MLENHQLNGEVSTLYELITQYGGGHIFVIVHIISNELFIFLCDLTHCRNKFDYCVSRDCLTFNLCPSRSLKKSRSF